MSDTTVGLPYTTRVLREVDYSSLERFIEESYGLTAGSVEIPCMEEWSNDTSHDMSIKKEELSDYDKVKLEKFKVRPASVNYMLYTLMIDLCNRDLIEPGDYLVSVSW